MVATFKISFPSRSVNEAFARMTVSAFCMQFDPTIEQLTKNEFNRYELVLATAKCARILTDEYVKQREDIEKSMTGNKESDRSLINNIDKDLKDEKAIKNAITRFHDGRYEIYREENTAKEVTEEVVETTEE